MLRPPRRIPKVAGAALLLGGCGGDGSNGSPDAGPDPSPAMALAAAYCADTQACDPTAFAMAYASLAECEAVEAVSIQESLDYYAGMYGAPCADAFVSFYDCVLSAYESPSCDIGAAMGSCADASSDLAAACAP